MNAFPEYTQYNPLVPVYCITPEEGRIIHRFFDTSPISPSGHYAALTRLAAEDRLPRPGDTAQVVLIDLKTGEETVAAETRGSDSQLGAQVQWGADDSQLFYNDIDTQTWRPYAVMHNPLDGTSQKLEGTVYMASRDGRWLASPCLKRTARTQAGYGVIVPAEHIPKNKGIPEDDGVYVTDTATGKCRLLVSLKDMVTGCRPALAPCDGGTFYTFHVKWNVQGTRLQVVVRWVSDDGLTMKPQLFSMNADGSDIRLTVPPELWGRGGHHPDWSPDGEHATMNLKLDGKNMRMVSIRYDGTDARTLCDIEGSGHPSLHPGQRYFITDAYTGEPVAFGDGTVPLRLVDAAKTEERCLVRICRQPDFPGERGEMRVDPHPAWDRSYTRFTFNGWHGDTRRVFIADLRKVLEE